MPSPVTRIHGVPHLTGTCYRLDEIAARVVFLQDAPALTFQAAVIHVADELELEAEQVEFACRYIAKRQARKAPERKAKLKQGRARKAAGYRCEKTMEVHLGRYGFKRMLLSGALGGSHSGDLRRTRGPNESVRAIEVVEVKRRHGQQTQLRRWLEQGGAHLLIVDTGQQAEPLCVVTLTTLRKLLDEGGYVCR